MVKNHRKKEGSRNTTGIVHYQKKSDIFFINEYILKQFPYMSFISLYGVIRINTTDRIDTLSKKRNYCPLTIVQMIIFSAVIYARIMIIIIILIWCFQGWILFVFEGKKWMWEILICRKEIFLRYSFLFIILLKFYMW